MWLRPKLNKNRGIPVNMLRVLMLLCVGVVLTSFTHQRSKEKGIITVVIDAGHGGHDSGCLGSHAKEKDVALSVALKLGNFITDNFKDVKVIYTRKTDVFLGLDERVAVANNNKADLFISIHCNSGARAAYGVETYVMGLHRTDENLAVSKRENSVVLLEKDYKSKYEGFDPDSPEGNIIFTLYQNAFLDQSLKISTLVQMETSEFAGRNNRGVKQAGFLVLYKTTMPSILVETGFLTNPAEERYLLSKEGQEKLAYSVFNAFSKYKSSLGTMIPVSAETNKGDSSQKKASAPQVPAPYDSGAAEAKTSDPKPNTNKPTEPKEEPKKFVVQPPAENTASKSKSPAPAETANAKPPKDSAVKASAEKVSPPPAETTAPKPVVDTAVKPKSQPEITKEVHKPAVASSDLYFTVQIATSGKPLSESSSLFKGEKNITSENVNGLYKYMTGKYSVLNEAIQRQNQLRAAGFPDAFVVAYHNGMRITLKEARMLLEKN